MNKPAAVLFIGKPIHKLLSQLINPNVSYYNKIKYISMNVAVMNVYYFCPWTVELETVLAKLNHKNPILKDITDRDVYKINSLLAVGYTIEDAFITVFNIGLIDHEL